jgi:uncharacterized protein
MRTRGLLIKSVFGAALLWAAGVASAVTPPLVVALRTADVAQATALLDSGADVRLGGQDGTTPLHWAAHHNLQPLVDRLLKAGADVNARNDYGATPLSEAAIVADPALVRRLLKAGADVESANGDGMTALMVVARSGNVEAAKLLLKAGAKVDAREQWRQQTALMWAAAQGQADMVRLLVRNGADVDARSLVNDWERQITAEPRYQARPKGGLTPLLYAARRGCVGCARALVEGGADVNLADPHDVTPLLMATQNLNFDTAAYLLGAGADPNLWDDTGRVPLYAAVDLNTLPAGGRADRPSTDQVSSLELIERLLKAGANPDMQLKLQPPFRSLRDDRGADNMLITGATPLLRAAKAADLPAMKLLIEHGANVELATMYGIRPLMAAAGNASSKIDTRGRYKTAADAMAAIDLLVSAGANVNGVDNNGQTALFGAAMWGWNDVVHKLLAHGAKLDVVDKRGRTPVDAALGTAGGSGRTATEPQPQTAQMLRDLMAARRP